MPGFLDYPESTAPLGSDILLADTKGGTHKLTIANLLKRGSVNNIPKFSLSDGLQDSGLTEMRLSERKLLYNLAEPIMTGGTGMYAATFTAPATVSIGGNIAARAINSEFYFENSWTNQNVMAIRNVVEGYGSFSTLRLLERGGWEMGSFGYGNTSATEEDTRSYPWYEGVYIETGNPNPKFIMHDVEGKPFAPTAPSPLRFIQSGVIPEGFKRGVGYFYVRQEFVPNGDIHFYDVSAPFAERHPALKFGWDGRLRIMPKISGAALHVQNRAAGEQSSIGFLSEAGRSVGSVGYGNPGGPTPELADSLYIVADAGSLDAPPPPLKLMQVGNSPGEGVFKTRFAMAASGRIVQAALPGVPDDAELVEASQLTFYVDEAANALMVKLRRGDGSYSLGEVAILLRQ